MEEEAERETSSADGENKGQCCVVECVDDGRELEFSETDAGEAVHGDAICSDDRNEPTENGNELLEQAMSASEIVKEVSVSEPATGDIVDEQLAEDRKSDLIKEVKVEESRQSGSNAEMEEKQENIHINNDAEQEDLVEVDTESLPVDQLNSTVGGHGPTAESSVCLGSSDTNAENSQSSGTSSIPDLSITQSNGDSDDASLGMDDQDATLTLGEVLTSSAESSNMPVEPTAYPPVAEEVAVALNANTTGRSLSVDEDISSPALGDGKLPAELEVVNYNDADEQILETQLEESKPTSSAYAEVESGDQNGLLVHNNISIKHHATKLAEIEICFGSIGHEELSSLSIRGRSSEAKSAVDSSVTHLLPDHEFHENADNNICASHGVDAVPQSKVSPPGAPFVGLAEDKLDLPEVESRIFNYLVSLPRYDGELTIQIKDAR
ncbi:hypothetical protein SAY86_004011 [Trapa natans]|uniref:Uncharacterized protein n=1 Tax=Trapa natans TaxID=22666 RepID=A0AAN7MF70_TRANT|nr:hypothetical protein SAY86_004011 [Trapa natans]